MATIHITEAEAIDDMRSWLAKVRAGSELIIENGTIPVAVVRPAQPTRRTVAECLAMLDPNSTAVIDPDFAHDVQEAADAIRQTRRPSAWD